MMNDVLAAGWFEASILIFLFLVILLSLGAAFMATVAAGKALINYVASTFFWAPRKPGLNRRVPLYSVNEDTGEICVRHPLSRQELAERRQS